MRRAYAFGMIAGWAFWIVLVAATYALEEHKNKLPQWMIDADLPDTIGTVFSMAAYPVWIGGYLIFGEGFQTPSLLSNAIVCLVLYGALGMITGDVYARFRKRSNTSPVPE